MNFKFDPIKTFSSIIDFLKRWFFNTKKQATWSLKQSKSLKTYLRTSSMQEGWKIIIGFLGGIGVVGMFTFLLFWSLLESIRK